MTLVVTAHSVKHILATLNERFVLALEHIDFKLEVASMQLVEMMAYAAKHFRLEQLCNVDYHWFKRFAEKRGYEEYLQYLKDRAILG